MSRSKLSLPLAILVSSMDIFDNIVPSVKKTNFRLKRRKFQARSTRMALDSMYSRVLRCEQHVPGWVSQTRIWLLYQCVSHADHLLALIRSKVLERIRGWAQTLGCPSAPEQAIVVFEEPDRPQSRLDRDISAGYAVSVGRVLNGVTLISGLQRSAIILSLVLVGHRS